MNKLSYLSALMTLGIFCVQGQDPKGGSLLMESQSPKKERSANVPVLPPKPTSEILGHKVVYGGYFTDFKRAEKKRPLFDLKAPLDPQKDADNLSFYSNSEKVRGVVLFSIKF